MKSEHLKEALYELQDLQGAHSVKVVMAPHAPFFQLAAKGNLGSLEVRIAQNSKNVLSRRNSPGSKWA